MKRFMMLALFGILVSGAGCAGCTDQDDDGITADQDCDDNRHEDELPEGITDDMDHPTNHACACSDDPAIEENDYGCEPIRCRWFRDEDEDGFGDPNRTRDELCDAMPEGFVLDNRDPNDDPENGGEDDFPGAPERCDGRDNDGDGEIDDADEDLDDEDNLKECFRDNDGDGAGTEFNPVLLCDCASSENALVDNNDDVDDNCASAQEDDDLVFGCEDFDGDGDGSQNCGEVCPDLVLSGDYVSNSRDCNDGDADNTVDDLDGDGFLSCVDDPDFEDCGPNDPNVHPGAIEIPLDGIDQDCNGSDLCYLDADGDGFGSTETVDCTDPRAADNNDDCDDDDDNATPEDQDGDGHDGCGLLTGAADCDDGDINVYPGNEEVPFNGEDEDCDGEDLSVDNVDLDGDCACVSDVCLYSLPPDADCSIIGLVGGDCLEGERSVNPFDNDGDGFNECDPDPALVDCNDGDNTVFPGATELTLDGVDQDCNGVDQCYLDKDGDGFGSTDVVDCGDPSSVQNSDDINDDCPEAHLAIELRTACRDHDRDGFGHLTDCVDDICPSDEGLAALQPTLLDDPFVFDATDCNDDEDEVNPGVDQDGDGSNACEDVDDDCPEAEVADDLREACEDTDNDGSGDEDTCVLICPTDEKLDALPGRNVFTDDTRPDDEQYDCDIDDPLLNQRDDDDDGETTCNGDCADDDDAIFSTATELPADQVDQNCDGRELCYVDDDSDGDGNQAGDTAEDNNLDCDDGSIARVSSNALDCDDGDDEIHSQALELVNDGVDQNCDGRELCYVDGDNDGFGNEAGDTALDDNLDCSDGSTANLSGSADDCEDGDADIRPDATEQPADGADQNCDGIEYCFEDLDDDGVGSQVVVEDTNLDCDDASALTSSRDDDCSDDPALDPLAGLKVPDDLDGDTFSSCDGDNDTVVLNNQIFPGATEFCDNVDQDLDGVIDNDADCPRFDDDGDCRCDEGVASCLQTGANSACGAIIPGDCDDGDQSIHPDATEVLDNAVDEDCDGVALLSADVDDDGDGITENEGDCDDTQDDIHPNAQEQCSGGTIDHDCDGVPDDGINCEDVDDDGDGVTELAGDCDDNDPDRFPGNQEVRDDGIDQDCSGGDELEALSDDDGDGQTPAQGDCVDEPLSVNPASATIGLGFPELCDVDGNGDPIDNNCNQQFNEGCDDFDHDGDCFCGAAPCIGSANAICDPATMQGGDCFDVAGGISPDGIPSQQIHPPLTPSGDPLDGEVLDNSTDENCDSVILFSFNVDEDEDCACPVAPCLATRAGPPASVCQATGLVGGDCDDNDSSENPHDEDVDGVSTCDPTPDCDDADPDRFPGNTDTCGDGIDQNCDFVDEICPAPGADAGPGGGGADAGSGGGNDAGVDAGVPDAGFDAGVPDAGVDAGGGAADAGPPILPPADGGGDLAVDNDADCACEAFDDAGVCESNFAFCNSVELVDGDCDDTRRIVHPRANEAFEPVNIDLDCDGQTAADAPGQKTDDLRYEMQGGDVRFSLNIDVVLNPQNPLETIRDITTGLPMQGQDLDLEVSADFSDCADPESTCGNADYPGNGAPVDVVFACPSGTHDIALRVKSEDTVPDPDSDAGVELPSVGLVHLNGVELTDLDGSDGLTCAMSVSDDAFGYGFSALVLSCACP